MPTFFNGEEPALEVVPWVRLLAVLVCDDADAVLAVRVLVCSTEEW